jgi:hypothetical protein
MDAYARHRPSVLGLLNMASLIPCWRKEALLAPI